MLLVLCLANDKQIGGYNTLAPDTKHWLTGKDPDSGKDRRQKEKRVAKDEMVRKHHQLNGHEFEQLWEISKDKEDWCAALHGDAESDSDIATEQQQQIL